MWSDRIRVEVDRAPRTWFITLTHAPAIHHRNLERARVRLWKGGTDYDTLSESDKFVELLHEYNEEITRYLKRVRKGDFPERFENARRREAEKAKREYKPLPTWKTAFRYVLVAELHTEKLKGLPHFHMLLHDYGEAVDKPVRYDLLSSQWTFGHSKFKLWHPSSDDDDPCYVAKYLSKQAIARVRASLHYGTSKKEPSPPEGIAKREFPGPRGLSPLPALTTPGALAFYREGAATPLHGEQRRNGGNLTGE